MNKILVLREMYPKINKSTFDQFIVSDTTDTKKYLPYMLKMWSKKKSTSISSTTLSQNVMEFDSLLPYIDNKDIFSKYYENYSNLIKVLNDARDKKEEKSFVKKDNITIIIETDDYLFLSPKTYKGSLKYGSTTKWCTASKMTSNYFNSYTKAGTLCYLINKSNESFKNTDKVGFYMEDTINGYNSLQNKFEMYNDIDRSISISDLCKSGWNFEDIFKIVMNFRKFAYENAILKNLRKNVNTTIDHIKNINVDELMNGLTFLEKIDNLEYSEQKKIIGDFLNKINNIK